MTTAQALDNVTQFPAREVPRKDDDSGTPSAVPASLFIKLFAIMQEMDGVPKRGEHSQKWKFMQADDVFNGARAAFLKHRVLVIPGVLPNSVIQVEGAANKNGNAAVRSLCVFTYTFIDVDTGQQYMTTWPGESQDFSDKGIQQSGTSSMKYMLMKMFLATPDHDPDYNTGEQPPKKQAATPPGKIHPPASGPVETPLTGGQTTAASRTNGKTTPIGGHDAPGDTLTMLQNHDEVKAARKTVGEARDTINKMWREQAIHADMSDAEIAAAVVVRLKRHRGVKTIGDAPDDAPEQEGGK